MEEDRKIDGDESNSWNSKSLGVLASEFVNMLQKNGGSIDLREFQKETNISRRRIYDITNALEGFGIIERVQRNVYKLTGLEYNQSENMQNGNNNLDFEGINEYNQPLTNLKEKYEQLCKEHEEKEQLLKTLEEENDNYIIENQDLLYFDYQDIQSIQDFRNNITLTLNLPKGYEQIETQDDEYNILKYTHSTASLHPKLYRRHNLKVDIYTTNSKQAFSNKKNYSKLSMSYYTYPTRLLLLSDSEEDCYSMSGLFLDQNK